MPIVASVGGTMAYGRPQKRAAAGGGVGPSTMRVNVIGDGSVATVVTGLNTARTALGYSNITMTYTQTALSNYTGSNLTLANFEAALVWTNGGITFNSAFGSNLNNYITSGGPVVFGVFSWGNVTAITNFTYTNCPYAYKGTQTQLQGTMTKSVAHPITANLSTTVTAGTTFATQAITVQSNATSIATYPDGTSMIAYQTAPRRVGVNLFPPNTADVYRTFLNSLMWAGGLLN